MLLATFLSLTIRNPSVRKILEFNSLCPSECGNEAEILFHRVSLGQVTQSPGAFGEHGLADGPKLRDGWDAAGEYRVGHCSVKNR